MWRFELASAVLLFFAGVMCTIFVPVMGAVRIELGRMVEETPGLVEESLREGILVGFAPSLSVLW